MLPTGWSTTLGFLWSSSKRLFLVTWPGSLTSTRGVVTWRHCCSPSLTGMRLQGIFNYRGYAFWCSVYWVNALLIFLQEMTANRVMSPGLEKYVNSSSPLGEVGHKFFLPWTSLICPFNDLVDWWLGWSFVYQAITTCSDDRTSPGVNNYVISFLPFHGCFFFHYEHWKVMVFFSSFLIRRLREQSVGLMMICKWCPSIICKLFVGILLTSR